MDFNNETNSAQNQPRVAVITGASAGLGRATVREFARHGVHLGLLARGHQGLEAARAEAEAMGVRVLTVPVDVAKASEVNDAATAIEERLGPIDVWVNNAMVTVFAPVADTEPDEFARVTEVTYLGTVYGTLAALRRMRARNAGVIVQVGSALAYRSIPLQAAYCAAKHAIQGFTESLRCELVHDQSAIHVTMVQMPALNTPQFDWLRSRMPHKAQPVPPIFEPELGARAIWHAATHRRRQWYVGGSSVLAIQGNKVAPRQLDDYLGHHAYKSQQTDEPEEPGRPDNLFTPVEGDRGARGRFTAKAHEMSKQFWLDTHPGWLAAGAAVSVGLLVALRQRKAA